MLNFSKKISLWMVWIAGGLILASAFLVTLEVILRKLLNTSIGGADELSGYAFGIASSFGLAYALHEKAHIRVDALYHFLPKFLKNILNLLGLVLLIGFATVITFMAWNLVQDTIFHGSRSITPMRTPLALPQIPWLFGWIFFIFSGLIILLVSLKRLIQKDMKGVDDIIGIKSIEDHIEDESIK